VPKVKRSANVEDLVFDFPLEGDDPIQVDQELVDPEFLSFNEAISPTPGTKTITKWRYRAIILRKNERNTKTNQKALLDENYLKARGPQKIKQLSSYSCCVPELHKHLPRPKKIYKSNLFPRHSFDQSIIDMYPTFQAMDETVRDANPGDYVWVTFEDLSNKKSGIYLGPIADATSNAKVSQEESALAKHEQRPPAEDVFNTLPPQGQSIPKPRPNPAFVGQPGWYVVPPDYEIPRSNAVDSNEIGGGEIYQSIQNVENGRYLSKYNEDFARQVTDYENGVVDARRQYPTGVPVLPITYENYDDVRHGFGANSQFSSPLVQLRADVQNDLAQVRFIANRLGAVLSIARGGEEIKDSNSKIPGIRNVYSSVNLFSRSSSLQPNLPEDYFEFEYFITKDRKKEIDIFGKNKNKGKYYFRVWALSKLPPGTSYQNPDNGAIYKVQDRMLKVLTCRCENQKDPAREEEYRVNVIDLTQILKDYGFRRVEPTKPWRDHCNPAKIEKYREKEPEEISSRWDYFYSKRQIFLNDTTWDDVQETVGKGIKKQFRKLGNYIAKNGYWGPWK
jgi:hypothetical protein